MVVTRSLVRELIPPKISRLVYLVALGLKITSLRTDSIEDQSCGQPGIPRLLGGFRVTRSPVRELIPLPSVMWSAWYTKVTWWLWSYKDHGF
ncbi:hypothetical protein AVEN_236197-1 [Araneus ventricosus]|uniref:Uncharacterized protein n=1 Tax=Araneus ventricosus TaxID=182803 RepID=A0A4Y2NPI1_ARAVE|nr:hypothetical protein AVEN_236197-1 [Araneus ventricosus]